MTLDMARNRSTTEEKSSSRTNVDERNARINVNCWFCNHNCYIDAEKINNWFCQTCKQYNGFKLDGDYNIEVPGQRDVKDHRTETVCEGGDFHSASSLLCAACNTNQILYVRQLASFQPMSEESYDAELESYRHYLEEVHQLCTTCKQKVKECVEEQDRLLRSRMSSSQVEKIKALNREPSESLVYNEAQPLRQIQTTYILTALFVTCLLLALLHVIICLRLYAVGLVSGEGESAPWLRHFMLWLMARIPAQGVLLAEESVIFLGAAVCIGGLFLCGKHSLYPEDSLLLLLWLVMIVTNSTSVFYWTEWLHVSDGAALLLSIVTATLALVACLRPRQPRHFSHLLLSRKSINVSKTLTQKLDGHSTSQTEPALQEDSESSLVDSAVKPNGPPPFEEVRQDLETFSIGLSKKSNSKSSIWSLPEIVTSMSKDNSSPGLNNSDSEPMVPDSTTEETAPAKHTPRSVLSPSRLGFLTFDSSPGSRSPSPWDPIRSNDSELTSHPFPQHCPDHADSELVITPQKLSSDSYNAGFVQQHSITNSSDLENKKGVWTNELRSPDKLSHALYTQHSTHSSHRGYIDVPHCSRMGNTRTSQSSLYSQGMTRSRPHVELQSNMNWSPVEMPKDANGARRRSQRLAMAGKLRKPWPLKKSLSCNNAMDRENLEKAGIASRSARVLPSTSSSPSERVKEPAQSSMFKSENSNLSQGLGSPMFRGEWKGNFSHYRDAKALKPLKSRHSPEESLNTNFVSRNTCRAKYQSGFLGGFSDEEDMEIDDPDSRGQRSPHFGGNDKSWRWILIGTVIGASITCNIFLLLHGWLQH
ncbi:transmembrane protein 201 [Plakobranchus ocellatus]|uniref:Transmembrane protein 201 n=1 Tax=Plakobranchus ocellatus TaxID=259542 RepID=A0AAV4CRB5_9GAST|nr:transmembrane protein 201 [Plakobranchus ocellatus]